MAIPFAHYVAGIRSGTYPALSRPTFGKSNSFQDIFYEEYQREYARKLIHGSSSNRTKSGFRTPFFPYFFPGLPLLPSSSQSNNSHHSNRIPRLNSDEVFGLVEELCYKCGNFKEIQIIFDKGRGGNIRRNHDSCDNGRTQSNFAPNESRDFVLRNFVVQRKIKPRIKNWTLGYTGINIFPLGDKPTKITICMGLDMNRSVTIFPTKDSIVKLNEPDLNIYDWLIYSLEHPQWNILLEGDIDSFIHLAGNRTWFFLKLFKGHRESQKCYFVMLINYQVNYLPRMADILEL